MLGRNNVFSGLWCNSTRVACGLARSTTLQMQGFLGQLSDGTIFSAAPGLRHKPHMRSVAGLNILPPGLGNSSSIAATPINQVYLLVGVHEVHNDLLTSNPSGAHPTALNYSSNIQGPGICAGRSISGMRCSKDHRPEKRLDMGCCKIWSGWGIVGDIVISGPVIWHFYIGYGDASLLLGILPQGWESLRRSTFRTPTRQIVRPCQQTE
jgi:hypothetical protein